MKPMISIVMPAFQAAATIGESIESVRNQTYKRWELLIVDDCSRDATRAICERYAAIDSRIRLTGLVANGGVARARNVGLDMATGQYFAFLDSDDLWHPGKLEAQVSDATPIDHFSYMAYEHMTFDGTFEKSIIPPPAVTYRDMLGGNRIGTLTVLIGRETLGASRFPVRGHEDYALWLELLRRLPRAVRRGGVVPAARYRRGDSSVSSNKLRAVRWHWDIYREQEKLSFIEATFNICRYAYRGLRKHNF